jgi:hypothetical protein
MVDLIDLIGNSKFIYFSNIKEITKEVEVLIEGIIGINHEEIVEVEAEVGAAEIPVIMIEIIETDVCYFD